MTEMTATMTSEAAIARLTRRPPEGASKLLGSEPLAVDAARGFARIAYEGRAEFCNERGEILGGFLSAMMDEAMAMAIAAAAYRDSGHVVPALGMKTSYLRAVGPGRLIAEGLVRQAQPRVVYLEGRLLDGKVCCDAENSHLAGEGLEAGPLDQLLGSLSTYRGAVGPHQGRTRAARCSQFRRCWPLTNSSIEMGRLSH